MRIPRPARLLAALCCALTILAGLAWQPGAAATDSNPPIPHAKSPPDAAGRATSIVPPPPQVVEQMKKEGQPLPDLQRYKLSPSPVQPRPLQGNVNLLVILVDFSDVAGTVTNLTLFNNLVFAAPVSGRGSVRDYYDEVTRGTITIATVNLPSTTGWHSSGNTMAYFADGSYGMGGTFPKNAGGMVAAVLPALDPLIDFSNYDNDGDGKVDTLLVMHAGTGAEWSLNTNHIWSHASFISQMGGTPPTLDGVLVDRYVTVPEYWEPSLVGPNTTDLTVGVACHEIAHGLFGLPDLYDLDLSSFGIGQWALMSYGDWNGPAKWNSFIPGWVTDGSSPAWAGAWTRVLLGWDTANLALGPIDNLCLSPVETTANAVLRFKTAGLRSQEYFLAENRRQVANSYDQYLPGSGMLIWHVDEGFWSIYGGQDNNWECRSLPNPHCWGTCATTHYLVALEQADRQDHLEYGTNFGDAGDPFPGSTNNTSWRWYGLNPVNPESGTWYDSGCSRDSCIDLVSIATSGNNVCFGLGQASCATAEADLGDAPASTNNHGNVPMTAYWVPPVQASFPTVFQGLPPVVGQGPWHHLALIDSWLGAATTVEFNADWPPDQDGMTNISPTIDVADMDSVIYGGDDGLHLPVPIGHCSGATVPFTLTVVAPVVFTPMPRYVNLWFDWNHDGDWADNLTCPGGTSAPEWGWQNLLLSLPPGVFPLLPPPITGKVSVSQGDIFEIWARLSVADMPAPAPYDGRGPAQGYDLGETEDYYLVLSPTLQMSLPPPPPSPGQQATYSIQYGGVGSVLANGVVISDVLPLGIEYVSANPPPDLYNPGTRTAYWTTNLDPTAPGTIQLTVMVTGNPGDTVVNPAYLLWGGTVWLQTSYSFQISCAPNDPTADFTWSPPVCAGYPVSFTNLTTGTLPLSYAWDLDGDGDTDSTAQNPTWVYAIPGSYTVTLAVTNSCGSDLDSDIVTVLQPLNSLAIAGPSSLLVGEEGTYSAVPTPPDPSNPHYVWDNGTTTITATYSWDTPGLYTIAVTGSNDCGSAAGTMDVLVSAQCISLTGVTIDGPVSLLAGEEGTYLATPQPPTATSPAYLWNNGDSAASSVYSWTVPGAYDVVVTASNCYAAVVTDTFPVLVTRECVSLTGVSISGPLALQVGQEGTYLATPAPPTATNPAYLWSDGSTGDSAVYSWTQAGTYTVTVTATNCVHAVVSDSLAVVVTGEYRIYLPLIVRGGP
jgi:immune inhibitor A